MTPLDSQRVGTPPAPPGRVMTQRQVPRSAVPRFDLDPRRRATVPPEHRGTPRDQVRLLIAEEAAALPIRHARVEDLPSALRPGDLLVVNTSPTRPAAIDGVRPRAADHHTDGAGRHLVVHLSTLLHPRHTWVVELRERDQSGPVLDGRTGERIAARGGACVELLHPAAAGPNGRGTRLWQARMSVPCGSDDPAHVADHMQVFGRPITYSSVSSKTGPAERGVARDHDGGVSRAMPPRGVLPLSSYQTVFAGGGLTADTASWGSAEMASAGRPISDRLVSRLVSRAVAVAPITLHAGVSSQTAGEAPQPEWFQVPATTAALVNHTHEHGGRVIAVGTTVTRALESAADDGHVRAHAGWTDVVITPQRGVQVVDGLLTGWHEADASHLLLLEAVAGADLVAAAYRAALDGPYLWHEFGDSCLLLPAADAGQPERTPRA